MSYCRWSSENFRSDVYCYEHCNGGFTTHVAGRRYREYPPKRDMMTKGLTPEQIEEIDKETFEEINLPHAGETFNDPTLEKMLSRLLMLRAVGYHVPEYALERIREEMAETEA